MLQLTCHCPAHFLLSQPTTNGLPQSVPCQPQQSVWYNRLTSISSSRNCIANFMRCLSAFKWLMWARPVCALKRARWLHTPRCALRPVLHISATRKIHTMNLKLIVSVRKNHKHLSVHGSLHKTDDSVDIRLHICSRISVDVCQLHQIGISKRTIPVTQLILFQSNTNQL